MAPPNVFEWSPDEDSGFVLDVTDEPGWDYVREYYADSQPNESLERIIEVCKEHHVRSIVGETRYIDLDYRSEHSAFYSTTFRRYPQVSHRLHFFTVDLSPDGEDEYGDLQEAYRGYCVTRPVPNSPIGRTMVAPPPSLSDCALALAEDVVHLYGRRLRIRAAPFMSQDGQYIRCAHAAMWMVLYHSHRVHGWTRRLPSDVQEATGGGQATGRQIPSDGLSVSQMLVGFEKLGAAPATLSVDKLASAREEWLGLAPVLCRYVNSSFPPLVVSDEHARVVVGYRRTRRDTGSIEFILNDDLAGPYIEQPVRGPRLPRSGRDWNMVIPVVASKMFVGGEQAEGAGRYWFEVLGNSPEADSRVHALMRSGRATYRTYAIGANTYKVGLADRMIPRPVAEEYRRAMWPRFVWVVELVDRGLRHTRAGADVLGEVILDATAHQLARPDDTSLLRSVRFGDTLWLLSPDRGEVSVLKEPLREPYPSGCQVIPESGRAENVGEPGHGGRLTRLWRNWRREGF